MNSIIIKNVRYNSEEKTYRINNNNSFAITLTKYVEDDKIIVLVLLKTLETHFNNIHENYRDFDRKLKLFAYLQHIENINLINNISVDVNNKKYFNLLVDSDIY